MSNPNESTEPFEIVVVSELASRTSCIRLVISGNRALILAHSAFHLAMVVSLSQVSKYVQ